MLIEEVEFGWEEECLEGNDEVNEAEETEGLKGEISEDIVVFTSDFVAEPVRAVEELL